MLSSSLVIWRASRSSLDVTQKCFDFQNSYWVFTGKTMIESNRPFCPSILDYGHDKQQEVFWKADTVSHLSWESCLPGMNISKCMFSDKEGIMWTTTSQNTHVFYEELIQSPFVVFGTKSQIRLSVFTVSHCHYPTWPSPHS